MSPAVWPCQSYLTSLSVCLLAYENRCNSAHQPRFSIESQGWRGPYGSSGMTPSTRTGPRSGHASSQPPDIQGHISPVRTASSHGSQSFCRAHWGLRQTESQATWGTGWEKKGWEDMKLIWLQKTVLWGQLRGRGSSDSIQAITMAREGERVYGAIKWWLRHTQETGVGTTRVGVSCR